MNILKNRQVQAAFVALVLAVLAALGFQGCASFGKLDPKAQRAVDVFECYVAVLEPYVGEVCDTAELVRDVVAGRADLGRTLFLLGAIPAEVDAIGDELAECRPRPQVSELPVLEAN
jgi:hypothetical protein